MSSQKAVLHYFNGRGRAEIIRLTMAAVGIEWSEVHLFEVADFQKLKDVPLLEIDGKKLVQSSAISRYIARKGSLLGETEEEMVKIDMLFEGSRDLLMAFMRYAFEPCEKVIENAKQVQLKRYLPIFEQVLKDNGSNGHLVGNKLTLADIGFLEPLLWVEEVVSDVLESYPDTQTVKSNENISNYLKSTLRPRINDSKYVAEVAKVLQW